MTFILNDKDLKCYLCGKSIDFFKNLIEPEINTLQKQIDNKENALKKDLQDFRTKMDNQTKNLRLKLENELNLAISSTEENQHLSFNVKTIESDISSFKKLIPNLEIFLKYSKAKEESIHKIREDFKKYLISLHKSKFPEIFKKHFQADFSKIQQIQDVFTKDKENKEKPIDLLKQQINGLKSFLNNVINEKTVILQRDDNIEIKINIKICSTCSELIFSPIEESYERVLKDIEKFYQKSRENLAFMIKKYVYEPDIVDCNAKSEEFAKNQKRKDFKGNNYPYS